MGLFGGQGIEGHLPGAGKVADLVLQGVMLLPAASCDVALFAAAAPPRWPPRPLRFRPLERQVAATRALYRYCITEGLLRGSNTGTPYRSGRGCARFKESCNPRMLLCNQRGCGLVPHPHFLATCSRYFVKTSIKIRLLCIFWEKVGYSISVGWSHTSDWRSASSPGVCNTSFPCTIRLRHILIRFHRPSSYPRMSKLERRKAH